MLCSRLGSARRPRPGGAPGRFAGCCRHGRRILRLGRRRFCDGSCIPPRRRGSSALCGGGARRRGSLRGIPGLLTCCLLQFGVLLAQPGDGALQLDDLRLELRLVQPRRSDRGRLPYLAGCACNGRDVRLGDRRHFVLRAERTARTLPGHRIGCSPAGGAGCFGSASHWNIHSDEVSFSDYTDATTSARLFSRAE